MAGSIIWAILYFQPYFRVIIFLQGTLMPIVQPQCNMFPSDMGRTCFVLFESCMSLHGNLSTRFDHFGFGSTPVNMHRTCVVLYGRCIFHGGILCTHLLLVPLGSTLIHKERSSGGPVKRKCQASTVCNSFVHIDPDIALRYMDDSCRPRCTDDWSRNSIFPQDNKCTILFQVTWCISTEFLQIHRLEDYNCLFFVCLKNKWCGLAFFCVQAEYIPCLGQS